MALIIGCYSWVGMSDLGKRVVPSERLAWARSRRPPAALNVRFQDRLRVRPMAAMGRMRPSPRRLQGGAPGANTSVPHDARPVVDTYRPRSVRWCRRCKQREHDKASIPVYKR
jgi:hypothetical protein